MAQERIPPVSQVLKDLGILLLLALLGCGTDASAPAGPSSSGIDSSATTLRVVFTDRQLQAAVQTAAGGADTLLTLDRIARLTQLDAAGRGITALDGINQLPGLQVLVLRDNRINDLSPLSTLTGLRYLDLENNRLTSVKPLAGLVHLEGLILDFNQVKDPSPLLGLTALRSVSLRGNPLDSTGLALVRATLRSRGALVDVEGSAGADTATTVPLASPFADAHLDSLARAQLEIFQPTPLTDRDLARVTSLTANNKGIHDLSGLERLPNLKALDLSSVCEWRTVDGQFVPDSVLYYNPKDPTHSAFVVIEDCRYWNQVRDLSPLAGLTQLERLDLQLNPVEDLRPLAGLVNLRCLTLGPCQVTDLSPLAGLHELNALTICLAPVSDLSPLAGLAKMLYLHLGYCQIKDLSPLAGLTRLAVVRLQFNQIEDISTLLHISGAVYLGGNPLSRESLEVNIPALQARGVTVNLGAPSFPMAAGGVLGGLGLGD